VTIPYHHLDPQHRPFHGIIRDGRAMPSFDVLERKEVLPLLARRIAQLPLMSKKILAMYYYESLSISEMAACFDLPACRIDQILTQTVGLLENYLYTNGRRHSGNEMSLRKQTKPKAISRRA
jgi:DNA-directed RNA polymerase specialized sigma subunit